MRKAVLFLTQVLPWPLDAGPKTRAYYVLRALAQQHDVALLSFVRASDTQAAVEHLRAVGCDVQTVGIQRSRLRDALFLAQSLARRAPFVIERDRSRAMEAAITRTLQQAAQRGRPFDVIHADQLWMAPYALFAREAAVRTGMAAPRIVLDQHNATYRIFERLAEGEGNPLRRALYAREAKSLARFELETTRRFDDVVWVTVDDLREMQRVAGPGEEVPAAAVIPICIDASGERPISPVGPLRRITFIGGLHYPPNAQGVLWFAREVLPLVLERRPDALFTVIGKQPPAELSAGLAPAANLDVTGYVEDPMPLLAQTAAFVVPLLAGGGMRVKILDAWKWGQALVSTTVGAEGIEYVAGRHLLCADGPREFADAVVTLLNDEQRRAALAAAGRAWVEEQYDWRTRYRAWLELYAGEAESGP